MSVIEKPLSIQKFLRDPDHSLGDLKKDPYKLIISAGPEARRIGFKYNQIKSDLGNRICQESRGLILEKPSWRVVSCSLPKFFNAAENHAVDIDWDSAEIFEKLDGSAVVIYRWQDDWIAHTLGTIEGEGPVQMDESMKKYEKDWEGNTFADLFWDRFECIYGLDALESLDEDCCYMFELCTDFNRVVKSYHKDRIVLLAVRNRETLKERDIETAPDFFDRPDRFDIDAYSDVMDKVEDLDPDDEGFVIVDGDWSRVKVKQESYVLRHKMRDSIISKKNGIIEAIQNEEADDFVGTFPKYKDVFEEVREDLRNLMGKIEVKYERLDGDEVDPDDHEERKEFALAVQDIPVSEIHGLFFQRLTGQIDDFWEGIKDMNTDKLSYALDKDWTVDDT